MERLWHPIPIRFGASFVVGQDDEMRACAQAAKTVFDAVAAHWRSADPGLAGGVWVREIRIAHRTGPVGAFHEDLLIRTRADASVVSAVRQSPRATLAGFSRRGGRSR